MNEGPATPPSEETPVPETPPAEMPAPPVPPPDYAAPPGYATPPGYAPPAMAAKPPRNMRTIIIAVAVLVVVIIAVVGYAVAGYAFASSRLDSARNTYNAVVSHQNAITDEFNTITSKVQAVNLTSSSASDFQTNKAAFDQLVSQSQAAQPTLTADDASLAAAQSSLSDNSWLTIFRKSDLDQAAAKIGHERKALANAKTILGDMVPLGNFFSAYDTAFIDLNTVATKEQSQDLVGAAAGVAALKADVTKALGLANAPGLPADMKAVLTDLQSLANDEAALLNAVGNGDATGADNAVIAITADINKLEAYNYDKISSDIKAYYQPLIDAFNAEVSKANSM